MPDGLFVLPLIVPFSTAPRAVSWRRLIEEEKTPALLLLDDPPK
jgi:hypothetical protein